PPRQSSVLSHTRSLRSTTSAAVPRPRYAYIATFTLPRPPSSTLFPYTTLFRSPSLRNCHKKTRPRPQPHAAGLLAIQRRVVAAEDRKSTRLNSSHVKISYAVFCLKKKNNKTTYITLARGELRTWQKREPRSLSA